jgi:hypothetical protein
MRAKSRRLDDMAIIGGQRILEQRVRRLSHAYSYGEVMVEMHDKQVR